MGTRKVTEALLILCTLVGEALRRKRLFTFLSHHCNRKMTLNSTVNTRNSPQQQCEPRVHSDSARCSLNTPSLLQLPSPTFLLLDTGTHGIQGVFMLVLSP